MLKAALFFEDFARRVVMQHEIGDSHVSTVFLGLDHNFTGEGPPILFETLVQGGTLDGHMNRYASWGEAARGHVDILRALGDALGKPFTEVAVSVAPEQTVKTRYERLLEE